MKQTAVDWLKEQYDSCNNYEKFISNIDWEQAKAIEEIEKLKRQLFIGKVSEIIGMDKTIELLKECNETFKSE